MPVFTNRSYSIRLEYDSGLTIPGISRLKHIPAGDIKKTPWELHMDRRTSTYIVANWTAGGASRWAPGRESRGQVQCRSVGEDDDAIWPRPMGFRSAFRSEITWAVPP